ncbi:alpha-L-fucosidase [Candidatus Desantisbacteria bacterium CG_4_10_14_0_8_um_filter_48_22]|uniref:alpha-L-fucosidase n=1 Tax=Candidatus Desantisbacteria bacterium CG_4_10_14_0_8_um_filter_48_22 TaxID=1974543 RepID=A0A2M7SFH7_9BACT|nr:MAG: alpha-L-fucosidase [Candidatus Desantisbacteria bacterium CG_4_10_14_0_8_um_filter_48_22]
MEAILKWFSEARFGLFIHWGLYAIPGRGEWVMQIERIPQKEYSRLAGEFNPKKFNADEWASLAKEAGMKYMVLTTRHHDGFCLWDSKVSDFTSVKTAAKRDFVKDYVEACRRRDIKVGLYYSLIDWRFPGLYEGMQKNPASNEAMVKQAHDQVRELMTDYGKIDILWFDGLWFPWHVPDMPVYWRSKELVAMVRKLQPQIIINDRSALPEDFTTPENTISYPEPGRPWESCMTIGEFAWGYVKNEPNMKSTAQLIHNLVNTAAGAGNLLLNVGPKADGTIQPEFTQRIKEMGGWLKENGESIYGSERTPQGFGGLFGAGMIGMITVKGNTAYVHAFRWPGKEACVVAIKNKVLSARLLASGKKAEVEQKDGRVFIKGLPENPPDPYDTVIALELDGPPQVLGYDGVPL